MENKVKVNIFGNNYNIQGDASSEYIAQIASYVDEKMEEVSSNLSTGNQVHIAILAALNIADEYFQLKNMESNITSKIENKASSLIAMIDESLIGDVFSKIDAVR